MVERCREVTRGSRRNGHEGHGKSGGHTRRLRTPLKRHQLFVPVHLEPACLGQTLVSVAAMARLTHRRAARSASHTAGAEEAPAGRQEGGRSDRLPWACAERQVPVSACPGTTISKTPSNLSATSAPHGLGDIWGSCPPDRPASWALSAPLPPTTTLSPCSRRLQVVT